MPHIQLRIRLNSLLFCIIAFGCAITIHAQGNRPSAQSALRSASISEDALLLRILEAEDTRNWNDDLAQLMLNRNPLVRSRATLAAGRIGNPEAVPALIARLSTDRDENVRTMAAFALGETEAATATDALLDELRANGSPQIRAAVAEALGKIAGALEASEDTRRKQIGDALLVTLNAEIDRRPQPQKEVVLLMLTAVLRARPATASASVAKYLAHRDADVRATAANTLARLRVKDANEALRLLLNDADPIARANAARALGAAEDRASTEALVTRATSDADLRVRVSAIRALGALKNAGVATPLLERFNLLLGSYRAAKTSGTAHPAEANELLELASALGSVLTNTNDEAAFNAIALLREAEAATAPELDIALARISPASYLRDSLVRQLSEKATGAPGAMNWQQAASLAQGLGEMANVTGGANDNSLSIVRTDALVALRRMLDGIAPPLAMSEVLRALAAYKPEDLSAMLRRQLSAPDVFVRATAAELLSEQPPDGENTRALTQALKVALAAGMRQPNDATLAILSALGKAKNKIADDAIKTALESRDHLVRRRAVALLKADGAGDFTSRVGLVASQYGAADYARSLARRNSPVLAVVATDKGDVTIELLPANAPLTVDNFIQLSRSGFFNGIPFHRVVPNFVVQGGDPRGDGNGGPPYQIRCEVNRVPYTRGAVGMALSGKDTGGSQWFVTHSPQPHLDGGYTVFGRVVEGMDAVDRIARGDRIRNVRIIERNAQGKR